jgi:hypothetical protein
MEGGSYVDRRLGLAYYRYNRDKIRSRVLCIVTNILWQSPANNFQVVFISSLFGGTGSGCLIDFALDLREWRIQLPGAGLVSCMAIGVLPQGKSFSEMTRTSTTA